MIYVKTSSKILSSESNYIVNVLIWPKFGNTFISMREVIMISIWWGFDQKNYFFWWVALELEPAIALKL